VELLKINSAVGKKRQHQHMQCSTTTTATDIDQAEIHNKGPSLRDSLEHDEIHKRDYNQESTSSADTTLTIPYVVEEEEEISNQERPNSLNNSNKVY